MLKRSLIANALVLGLFGPTQALAQVTNGGGGSGSIPTGSAGLPNAAVLTVQGISGGTGVPVICSNCSGSGVSATDKTPFTSGTSLLAPGGGFYQTTPTSNPLTNGQQGMWQFTPFRAGMIDWYNSSGAEMGTSGAPVRVDPTGTTTQPVSAASLPLPTGAATAALQPTNAAIGSTTSGQTGRLSLGAVTTAAPTYTTGQTDPLSLDTAGNLRVNVVAGGGSGGTALTDNSAFTQSTTSETPLGCLYISSYAAATSGHSTVVQCDSAGAPYVNVKNYQTATTPFSNIVANNTTAVVLKASPGTLFSLSFGGIGSTPIYVKFYNATSATCGSGTPVMRMIIPANTTAADGAGSNPQIPPQGISFTTGITYCATGGIADADTTSPAASSFLINGSYQ